MDFYRHLFSRLSPAGERGKLSILIFHRVLPSPDPLFPDLPDAAEFNRILGWLNAWFNVVPLQQAITSLRERNLPERAAVITFDDGYADNHDVALPLLVKNGLPATFFVTTGFLDGGVMWNDAIIEAIRGCNASYLALDELGLNTYLLGSTARARNVIHELLRRIKYLPIQDRLRVTRAIASIAEVSLPKNLMMSSSQVVALRRAGMEIGAHTVSHPILAKLGDEDAQQEISASKRMLEDLVKEPIRAFAYPNGKPDVDFLRRHVDMVKALGFDAGVSTARGSASISSDRMCLPRFTPWDRSRARFGARIALNLRAESPS